MAEHYATPNGRSRRLASGVTVGQHLQEAIDKAEPGDTIHLLPGVYDEPVVIEGKRGTPERPLVLLSDGCATLDGRRNVVRPPDIGGIT